MRRAPDKPRRTKGLLGLACALFVVGLSATSPADSGPVTLVVVVGPSSAWDDVSMNTLRNVFSGETVEDPSGQKLVPFNQPPHTPDRVGFDRVVLDMSPDEVARYWIDRKIRGHSGPPRTIDNTALLKRVVARLPGAISYVKREEADSTVKVLKLDGKRPLDPGYPLKYKP